MRGGGTPCRRDWLLLTNDGTRTFINFDQDGGQAWTQSWFSYDMLGLLDSVTLFNDDGTRTYINIDEEKGLSWSQSWSTLDTQGRLDTQDIITTTAGTPSTITTRP